MEKRTELVAQVMLKKKKMKNSKLTINCAFVIGNEHSDVT
jgi:hypothetical protein